MTADRAERRLAAIMATDIVGYSRLIDADETATLTAIKTLREEVIDPLVAEHRGRIVKLMGDGALVEFNSVVDAVVCAVAMQKGIAAHQAGSLPSRRIVFRIGINLGDVVVEGADLFGDGVNVAARLEQLCPPGGVLISGTAYDQMKGKLSLPLDNMGEQRVKNISDAVRTYSVRMDGAQRAWKLRMRRFRRFLPMAAAATAVTIALVALWWTGRAPPATRLPMVAVLPFENYGKDEATGRLADGLTEDIVTDLARHQDFEVLARNSTERYRGQAVDVKTVAADLDADFVLEGSIQHQAGTLRITAQLIDAESGNHIWSERWDRPDRDFFTVQSEIAQAVSNTLGGGRRLITAAELEAARRTSPRNLSAYQLYLMGMEKLESGDSASLQEAVALLKRALALDPGLARAWSHLHNAYDSLAYSGVDSENSWTLAAEAAERAIQLDPNDPYARVSKAFVHGQRNDFAGVKSELDTALRLAPNSTDVLTQYANWAAAFTDPAVGGEMADKAIRLDPDYSSWAATRFVAAYFMAERYDDAARIVERISTDAYFPDTWVYHPGALAMLGRAEEAAAWVKKALAANPDLTIEWWVNQPGFPERDRVLMERTMRKAGFPLCSRPEKRAALGRYRPIRECEEAAVSTAIP